MQGAYITITIGIQFFIVAGYMFYFIFRKWASNEDRIALMSWTAVLIGLLTLWLFVSDLLGAASMSLADIVLAGGLIAADFLGLYLLADDILRRRQPS
jgi:EamA domain-containing membrane protein RarD